jgi:hypothetical protein
VNWCRLTARRIAPQRRENPRGRCGAACEQHPPWPFTHRADDAVAVLDPGRSLIAQTTENRLDQRTTPPARSPLERTATVRPDCEPHQHHDHSSSKLRTVRPGCQPHPSVPVSRRADHREPARPANHARPTDHPSNGPRTVRTGSTRLPTASQRAGQSSSGPPTVWISSTS